MKLPADDSARLFSVMHRNGTDEYDHLAPSSERIVIWQKGRKPDFYYKCDGLGKYGCYEALGDTPQECLLDFLCQIEESEEEPTDLS